MDFTRVLVWTATAFSITGALCTSLRIDPANIWLLNIGAALFLWWGVRIQDRAMIAVNSGFLLIYAMGLFLSK